MIESFILRGFLLLLGAWIGVGMVVAVLLMIESWKRRGTGSNRMRVYAVTECPACYGTGVTPEQEICGLCDGESAITSELSS